MTRLTVNPTATPVAWAVLAFAAYSNKEITYDASIVPAVTIVGADGKDTTDTTDTTEILQALADPASTAGSSSKSAEFIATSKTLNSKPSFAELTPILDSLDDHLAYRTFLDGHALSVADWAVWGAIKGNLQAIGILKKNQVHTHVSRWWNYIESLPSTHSAITTLADQAKLKKAAAASASGAGKESASFALGLPNAKDGHVVTRFPPEPSGYLHIGHAKAALLNQYFAQMYHGKMIIRFDDTNPSKEKAEFEETILEDLNLMGIQGDEVTHTSDHFDKLYAQCVEILKRGKAYADDTEQTQMRDQRFNGVASARRDSTIEENLSRFEEMTKGTEEGQRWCIRAKMSVDDPNKAMRDPVIYRCNVTPHHRTGDKWKVYPTYDFACPLVDSLEGVTHALRTNEYRDRNPQYQWMLDALDLRRVEVWDFSRINFIYTLLSKRKLHWFVDNKLVGGWDDPRFPTVRGIRRRGLTVEALKTYMLQQGPSQAQMSLEWDGIWAANKKVIDPIAPRFWAIASDKRVPITVKGGPVDIEIKDVPKHKKNPDIGMKKTAYASVIFVEQEDAASFDDQEEVTLMDWGNAIIRKKTVDASGVVTSIEADLHLEGDFKKTKKKITWLPEPTSSHPLPKVALLDYDYLITKKKLEDGDEVPDFVTPTTEYRVEAFADANVVGLKKGDVIQFERKGYYIVDRIDVGASADTSVADFICIPDGRAAGLASKAATAVTSVLTDAKDKVAAVVATGPGWGKNAGASKNQSVVADGAKSAAISAGATVVAAATAVAVATTTAVSAVASTLSSAAAAVVGGASAEPELDRGGSVKPTDRVTLSEGKSGFEIPVTTSMYDVPHVVGTAEAKADTSMYKVESIYNPPR